MLTGEILRIAASRHPNRTAVVGGRRHVSYGELDSAANRFANGLSGLGIGTGDTVAVMSRNVPDYVIAQFGTARAGTLLVNTMPAYSADELVATLGATRVRLIVVEETFQEKIADIADRLPFLKHVVVIGDPAREGWASLQTFLAGNPDSAPAIALSEDDPVAMTFTGGTTGRPKGAVVSHRARFVSAWTTAIEHNVTPDDIVGLLTPLYHAMGSQVWLPTAFLAGATVVMMTGWDPEYFLQTTARHRISNIFMVPVQLRELLSDAWFDAKSLSSLGKIACGGALTPPDLVHCLRERLPDAKFANHYGQSETGPISFFRPGDPLEKAGTVGRPAVGVELKLIAEDGRPAATGETGEIVVRGPFLMNGYFENDVESAAYFRNGDGWGWTGDLAAADEDGFLTLVGRSKDMIVSGGVNIYPREVEIVLENHPAIVDCAVFGIPDDRWGEALCALVVRRKDVEIGEDDVVTHCTDRLARFKRPKIVRFVDAIPKTPSGKVQKPKLREEFLAGGFADPDG